MARPNIVLIMADQQRTDSLGCYGNVFTRTQEVDRLAQSGVRFTRAMTPWPVCTPARGTMWSGVYAHKHRLIENVYGVDDAFAGRAGVSTTVFDLLKRAGYTTAHFGKWHLGENQPKYFDVWEESFNSRVHHWIGGLDSGVWRPGLQTDRSIAFLDSRQAGGPPFIMVQGYYPPHDPYTAPKEFYEPYRDKGVPFPGYYAGVSAVDYETGRILDALERNGLRHNTLVIYYADHGDTFFYRGGGNHKYVCFDDAIRIPFIMSWPAVLPVRTTNERMIGLQDLMPTILEAAGAPIPDGMHGRSVLPLARGETTPWRQSFYVQNRTYDRKVDQRCYRTDDWKLIASGEQGEHLLFDLARDPEEEWDLFLTPREDVMDRYRNEPSHAPKARELAEAMRKTAASLDDPDGIAIADRALSALAGR
jgi:choline-sulfatase